MKPRPKPEELDRDQRLTSKAKLSQAERCFKPCVNGDFPFPMEIRTSTLSKGHMMRDSSGPTTWVIVHSMQ